MNVNMSDDDKFQCWLIEMDFSIDALQEIFSSEGVGCLDYSVESLSVLENWLQSKYPNLDSTKNSFGNKILDMSACYVGETLRKNFGGEWILNTTDPKRVFYGIPELKGIRNQTSQICPLVLVTTLISRGQKGFLRKIFDKHAGSEEE